MLLLRDKCAIINVYLDETETDTSRHFCRESETRRRHVLRPSRDRDIEAETTTLLFYITFLRYYRSLMKT